MDSRRNRELVQGREIGWRAEYHKNMNRLTQLYHGLTSYTVDCWRVIYPLLYAIFIVVVAWWGFVINQQGEDFFTSFVEDPGSRIYFAKSVAALSAWCLIFWYTSRILLRLKNIEHTHENFVSKLIEWLPRILGIAPILIFIYSLNRARLRIESPLRSQFYLYLITCMVTGALLFSFYIARARIAKKLGIELEPNTTRFKPGKITLKQLFSNRITQYVILIVIFLSVIIFFSFLLPVASGYAQRLKPATVLLIGYSFFTILFTVFLSLIDIRRSPFGVIIFLYIITASRCNDNSELRTVAFQKIPERETLGENLKTWVRIRLGPAVNRMQQGNETRSFYPLVLVAAEGGGIRAMNWTAQVLQRLEEIEPGFNDHVYAISGVSGGGVGSVFYDAYYRDKRMGVFDYQSSKRSDSLFREALSSDFLSDVTGAFLFQENLQRLLFWPVLSFNRDRRLEDSWSQAYKDKLLVKTFEEPFLHLWECDSALRYRVPNLIINGVLAESGQKAITSNLDLKSDSSRAFEDEVDVLQTLGYDVPLKTAASLCSRFPLITSGGLLKKENGADLGHVVDGGYKENTGIETTWQLMVAMRPYIEEAQETFHVSIPVYLLFIQNSSEPGTSEKDTVKAMKTIPDLSTVFSGFINSWNRRTPTFKRLSLKVLNESQLKRIYGYHNISLRRGRVQLPLGWYLSKAARDNIEKQAGDLNRSLSILKAMKPG